MLTPRRPPRPRPRWAASLAAAGLSCLVMVTACTSGGAGSAQASGVVSATTPGLRWHSCTNQGPRMQCSSLQVPLDYAHPAGRKITLALSMVAATAPAAKQQGDLLVNPAALTITANGQTITYGTTVPATTVSYNGFITGESSASLTSQPKRFSQSAA